jgi:mannose-6-phosphate isomerase-like protein (cupin superfamily)
MLPTDFDSTILLRSEETQGRLSIIDVAVPAIWEGPPLHHHEFDESFYILAGELTFQLGDELVTRGAGTFTFAPGGAIHTLANLSGVPARYVLVCSPGGFENRFDPDSDVPTPPVTVVGPPIATR